MTAIRGQVLLPMPITRVGPPWTRLFMGLPNLSGKIILKLPQNKILFSNSVITQVISVTNTQRILGMQKKSPSVSCFLVTVTPKRHLTLTITRNSASIFLGACYWGFPAIGGAAAIPCRSLVWQKKRRFLWRKLH